ncbi:MULTISPECIES: GNAT family N-acetyltransferase [unclassified Acinetobacter]|jgi:GNAT superfamily N-acetyltransferase|uniref:GNAT family N-acetyltransferase n=1 Tax=Acinetobacter TaxID=469 RepID=UPI0018AB69CB|nr:MULTISPECIES: GNAT family N-acetyltransferase [unclassified Acinetobacter]MBJ9952211.1 GNAT family N-acetyltransferase [Acinetobacter baumannii]
MQKIISTARHSFVLRKARAEDLSEVLDIFDDVVAWLVSIGNTQQWGVEPWSTSARQIARVTETLALPDAWVVETQSGRICAAIVMGDAMSYVPSAAQPECYIRLLIVRRDQQYKGIGRQLLAFADQLAKEKGIHHLRLDCYAGGNGNLVKFYESCGYRSTLSFQDEGWHGQVLERDL